MVSVDYCSSTGTSTADRTAVIRPQHMAAALESTERLWAQVSGAQLAWRQAAALLQAVSAALKQGWDEHV